VTPQPEPAEVLQLLRSAGASLSGHFGLTPTEQQPVCVVASPVIGGLIIGHEVARALGARFIFTDWDPLGKKTLRRGFAVTPGEIAALGEDVVTTGGSRRAVVGMLKR